VRGLLWLWSLALRNELPARRPVEVQPLVWVGGIPTPGRWRALRRRGVKWALSLLGEIEPPTWVSNAEHLLWLRVPDRFAPTLEQLVDAADFLDRSVASQTGVLIFCGSGIGRAPTTYAAWRMRASHSDPEDALAYVLRVRSIASPTREQRSRLKEWFEFLRQ